MDMLTLAKNATLELSTVPTTLAVPRIANSVVIAAMEKSTTPAARLVTTDGY
jgi:hypothetical protein